MTPPAAPKPSENKPFDGLEPIEKLRAVMARLRDPDNGCPWDLEQDFASIAPHTIEEAYEVADAINRGTMDDVKDELGDLLFQVIFYAQMAAERGLFDFNDIARHSADKMISRHPHVFGDQSATDSAAVMDIWEAQKTKEKAPSGDKSVLDDVTIGLPALLRAQKLQKKASKQGFTWKTSSDAWAKVAEEYEEVQQAISGGNQDDIAEELGDLMFCLVNFARIEGLDAEEIMRKSNDKFINNYNGMTDLLKVKNKDISALSLEEMLTAWKEAKNA